MQVLHKGVINIDELSNTIEQHFPTGAIREQYDYVIRSIENLLSNCNASQSILAIFSWFFIPYISTTTLLAKFIQSEIAQSSLKEC